MGGFTIHSGGTLSLAPAAAFAKDGGSGDGSHDGGGDSDGGDSGHGGGPGPSHSDNDDDNGGSGHKTGQGGERIKINGNRIEVVYPNGWKEEVRNGIFEMHDPAGRLVIRRTATAKDRNRLKSL